MQETFGALTSGYLDGGGPALRFDPDPPDFGATQRIGTCDAQGGFVFDRVRDGVYYLVTMVQWQAGNVPQGGVLMRREAVSGGTTARVVMTR